MFLFEVVVCLFEVMVGLASAQAFAACLNDTRGAYSIGIDDHG